MFTDVHDIQPEEAEERVSILIHNTRTLRDAATRYAHRNTIRDEMHNLYVQFQNLLSDLRNMEQTTGKYDMPSVFIDGVHKLQEIKQQASDKALLRINNQAEKDLKSWNQN